MKMLVNLYAPDLIEPLAAVEKAGPKLGRIVARVSVAQSGNHQRDAMLIDALTNESKAFDVIIDDMCIALVDASRSLDHRSNDAAGEDRVLSRFARAP